MEKKDTIFLAIKVVLIVAIVLLFCQDSVIELLKTGYVELQKQAYEGKDVHGIILSVLAVVTFFITVLFVLFFILSPHQKPGSFMNTFFICLMIEMVLVFLNQFYKEEIANYLKTTYQVEQNVSEKSK